MNIKYPAAWTKVAITKIIEITGFLEVIAKTLENKVPKAKIFTKKVVIFKNLIFFLI